MVLKVQAKGGFTSDFIISQETLTMRAHRGGGVAPALGCVEEERESARERERQQQHGPAFRKGDLTVPRARERERVPVDDPFVCALWRFYIVL